jgi:outer membrane receptor protein involved in Fe transport
MCSREPKKGWLLFGVLLVLMVAYPASKARGQAVYGTIVGTVVDSSGAAVPNATVTITDVNKNVSYTTTTNAVGAYEQTHLIVGVYDVRVEAQGFQAFVQKAVQVNVDTATQVNATMQLGAVTQEVTVTAAVPLLKTERTDVSTTFSQRAVEDLPIFNRNFTDFELLTPGTQKLGWQHASSENPQGSIQIMVNGQHFSGTSFQLDGTDNRDPILGIIVINPNLDGVTEAKVTSQDYDAEFGQALAGVVTAQTKSGTNDLHGSAFWYRRDNNFTARNPFSQSLPNPTLGANRFIPVLLRNQLGGSAGGPIKKNKTFIFGDYQGTRITNGGSVLTRVPTATERTGDLSALAAANSINIYNPFDASGNPTVSPTSRPQFMGNDGKSPNVVPTSLLSSQAQNLLTFIPLPNLPATAPTAPNFSASGTEIFNSDGFDVRADQYQTEKLHMFGRYSFQRFDRSGPGAFGAEAGGPAFDNIFFAGKSSVRDQSIAYGFDYTVSPTVLTDFRFGFFRYRVFVNPNGLGTTPAKDAGIPGLNLNAVTSGMPAFFINGSGGFSFGYSLGTNQCNCPLNEQEQQFQLVNNWTNIRGNHTFKFGADVRHAQNLRVPSDQHRAGQLSFNNEGTEGPSGGGLGLATFLIGDVNFFNRYVSNVTTAAERQNRLFFYGQDTWRITPKLTFNYGVRWEIYAPQRVNDRGNGGFIDPSTGEVLVAGSPGVGLNGNVGNTFTNFAPRAGLAYQLRPKTVVRVGYGRAFDVGVFGSTFGHSVTQNVPVLATQSSVTANSFDTAFTLAQGPPLLDPSTVLQQQLAAGHVGITGRPLLPDGITQFVLPFKMRMPTVDAWNLAVQHQLTPTIAVEVAYVGNKGTHIFAGDGPDYDFNQPTEAGLCLTAGCPNNSTGRSSRSSRQPFFSKYGWEQSFRYFGNDSNNNFNSLQVKAEKRFSTGYSFLAHYTWARALNHDSNYWPVNGRVGYGPTDWQRTHVFLLTNIWDLPFGKGKKWLGSPSKVLDYVIGGWQVNAVTTAESGLPYTLGYQNCGSDIDNGPCRVDIVGPVRINRDANIAHPDSVPFFTTTGGVALAGYDPVTGQPLAGNTIGSYRRPFPGTFGNATRNSFHGPRFFNTDFSVFKNFVVTEKVKGQFQARWFNLWNDVNLGNPDSTVDSGDAGLIHGLAPGAAMRQVEFALRFDF